VPLDVGAREHEPAESAGLNRRFHGTRALAKARLEYADGVTEDIVWKNGEEFADYVRPYEVPGSKSAGELLTSGQVRWFAIVPKRQEEIRRIILESFNNQVAPTFVALTAQTE